MQTPLPIAALAAASHLAPTLVAPLFGRMMVRPRRGVRPAPRLALPPGARRLDLGDGLVAWRWGTGQPVLLVHGFEGNRSQFAAIVEALLARGLAAVALDVPGHGESVGRELTVTALLAAIMRALAVLGPLRAVIGHSLGGAMSVYAVARRGGVERLAVISAPSSLLREMRRFAETIGLSERGAAAFIAAMERRVGQPATPTRAPGGIS